MLSSQRLWPRLWSCRVFLDGVTTSSRELLGACVHLCKCGSTMSAPDASSRSRIAATRSIELVNGRSARTVRDRDEPLRARGYPSMNQLRSIARRAMLQRGLLPDFSPAVLAETDAITEASRGDAATASATCARSSGLRSTTTTRATSISSRSPSRCPAGRREDPRRGRRRRRAREAALRDRRPRAGATRPPCTRRPRSSRCCPRGSRPTSPRSARARSGWRS